MQQLISVDEAKQMIMDHTQQLAPKQASLVEAAGLTLAQDVVALLDVPGFPQSGMDGYAFAWEKDRLTYHVDGEMAAGASQQLILEPGHAVRIFTGAPVPQGADTVVMQEKTEIINHELLVKDDKLVKGMNVRGIGTDISKGTIALTKGTKLIPSAIGFLAAIGEDTALVHPAPSVGIILTGNEIQHPGKELHYGQVFDSNSYALIAGFHQLHIHDVKVYFAKDDLNELTEKVKYALDQHDMVLLTGGVSVGDYDFTLKACEASGVQAIFHKVKQKPGKPLFFGKYEKKVVFGMPGNPASVLTGFYEYVYTALSVMMNQDIALKKIHAPLANDFKKAAGLTHFLKAWYDGEKVSLLTGQESYKMGSFTKANSFAIIPEETIEVNKGSMIEVHLLPN